MTGGRGHLHMCFCRMASDSHIGWSSDVFSLKNLMSVAKREACPSESIFSDTRHPARLDYISEPPSKVDISHITKFSLVESEQEFYAAPGFGPD